MKNKKIILFLTLLYSLAVFSQEVSQEKPSVEKSMFSVQAGYLGLWANEEIKLTNLLALRFEVGANYGASYSGLTGFKSAWVANFRLEPRFYYNLGRKIGAGKDISNNSGNFVTISFNYFPKNAVLFSNNKNVGVIENFSIVPKYGIRRNISKHFNYEAGFGIGFFYEPAFKDSNAGIDLHLRIGYTF
jgi:hypothetical protein